MGLLSFDFSNSIVGLKYNGHLRYKSTLGGFVTLLTVALCIAIAGYFTTKFFLREEPKMTFETMKYWDPPSIDVSQDLPFVVMMKYAGNNIIHPDVIKIEAVYRTISSIKKTDAVFNISPVSCNRSLFTGSEELYDSLELSKGLCFNTNGMQVKGSPMNEEFSYISIRFLLCLEEGCSSQDKMRELFQDMRPVALIYFFDTAYLTNSKNNPIKKFVNYLDVNVTFDDAKATNMYFSNNQLIKNIGYLFNDELVTYSNLMLDSFRDLVSVRTETQVESLYINFMSSKNEQIIRISYMSISELLANVGALTNVVIHLFTYFVQYVNHYFFQNDLIAGLYSFNESDEKKKNGSSKCIRDLQWINQIPVSTVTENEKNRLHILEKSTNKLISNTNTHLIDHVQGNAKIRNPFAKLITNQQDRDTCTPSCNENIILVNSKQPTNLRQGTLSSQHVNDTVIKHTNMLLNYSKSNKLVTAYFSQTEVALFAVFPFIVPCCGKLNQKKKLFKQFESRTSSYQDFSNLFKKLQEIDMIKYLILNEDQIRLYKLIPKPELIKDSLKCTQFSKYFHDQDFHYLKSLTDIESCINTDIVKNCLLKIGMSQDKSPLDEKLLKLITEKLCHDEKKILTSK